MALLISFVFFNACSENNTNTISKEDNPIVTHKYSNTLHANLANSIENIGITHNRILDSMYSKLLRIKSNNETKPNITLDQFLKVNTQNYLISFGYSPLDTNYVSYESLYGGLDSTSNTIISLPTKNMILKFDSLVSQLGITLSLNDFQDSCDIYMIKALNIVDSTEAIIAGSYIDCTIFIIVLGC